MSYIDTINHSVVGTFANISVYHPLQILEEKGHDEFNATPQNFVIGGGSGEHPGMVIKNLDACVWDYIEFMLLLNGKDAYEVPFYINWLDSLNEEEQETYSPYNNLEYNYWHMENVASFSKYVNKTYKKAIKYYPNKKEFQNPLVEHKVNIMFGEFIYFSARNLLTEKMQKYLQDNTENIKKEIEYMHSVFNAIIVAPKGYPVYGRHYVKNNNGERIIHWGTRFDEEYLIDKELNMNIKA